MLDPFPSRTARLADALRRRTDALRLQRFAAPAVAIGICALLLVVFQHLSQTVDYRSVIRQLWQLTPAQWIGALAATALSYAALIGRDAVGLRHLEARVSRAALFVGATAGSALGNVTGFGALTGGAVRCRVYGGAGVTPAQVGKMTVFTGVTLALALALMTALGMIGAADTLSGLLRLPPAALRWIGGATLALGAAMIAACPAAAREVQLSSRRWLRFTVPARRDLVAQLLLAVVDVAGAGLALWAVLPHAQVGFLDFLTVYSAAMLLGLIGHTPGGIGVFEAAMVFALGGSVPTPHVLAALLAYRAIYFGAPLALSAALLAGFEGRALKTPLGAALARRGADGVSQLAPLFLAIVTFVTGSMLVISGATPAFARRIALLQTFLPLWVLESSQLLGSLFGVLLLFVARGLLRRLDAAWWFALILAVVNLALSLTKGLAFVEAGVLTVLIALLIATRGRFDRHSSLFAERFTPGWLASVGCVIALAVWVLLFAFRDVQYSQHLWWQFAFDGRAPRALRATLGAGLFAAALACWQLLRPAAGRFVMPASEDLVEAARIVRAQERSDAGLALMGDKSFLFSASRNAFLMYAKRGRTWAALHDPVGPRSEWAALIREFVTLAHAHGGRAAFYQVRADALPLYLDAGLTLMKLGEEAHIALPEFDLKGSHRSHLRYALKRGERDGFSFELIDPDRIAANLPVLREISDAWLEGRDAREKSFSVAAFDDNYLAAQSVLLVRQNDRPLAFVTFMTTDLHTEATVGVMRHQPDASPYAMEYLFTQLALHLKAAGFQSLSLGIAPLSGMQPTPLASPWHRIAGFVWRFGGRFYNFRGLRGFKNKFQPRWEPRYLAASGSIGVFITLADLSLLAGGWRS
ncbi:bifunctional lysylphosphatidylglycerol flippase/synthetase MprF [Paraburkholderia caballeronis]|uniref:Phosphatidylglycerol lysyltransferase n=1 Tax=Paraburkholderia caballeronis TaxID=416943 RepID=A0A1H7QM95_9BURK|nr:bifunctional lysylphosphatidylglycerol flippase/synthetase MprF [Paraburkholderia caballeronis]PXW22463.1 phosphatidylglycerol lysyltransferase [Paraburkholderia caballeronis]PXW96334.1 phosphatidylglycerol lysyltransferase [Paraburkholderia caballeronis]RAJ92745.1 phosphatidylglycerol lysyltransferase [Paraburkholderia caballeronis]TDV34469.1 phosphatidylglycerol lysyltransferase [Paraburkholderia caballeronis]SEE02190.1 phosphatidylglycerol lysyltransferase [Paraburkholderia caballeronis]